MRRHRGKSKAPRTNRSSGRAPRFDPAKESARPHKMRECDRVAGAERGFPKGKKMPSGTGVAALRGKAARKDVAKPLKPRPDYKCNSKLGNQRGNWYSGCQNVPEEYVGRKACRPCRDRMKNHPVFGIGSHQTRPIRIVTKTVGLPSTRASR